MMKFCMFWWGVAIDENQLKILKNEIKQQPGVCQWNRTQLDWRSPKQSPPSKQAAVWVFPSTGS